MASSDRSIDFGGTRVRPGTVARVDLRVSRLPTGTWISLPIAVVHGRRPGPTIWLSAAIHGDELNGVAVISRVMRELDPKHLAGTVIAVPIVNVFGFLNRSRYLPDRRDLNRSFPGSPKGSLAARLAHQFMTEVVARCSHGIDLHTGSHFRSNLPQIRADLENAETRRCAEAFAAPLTFHARVRDGSLREAASRSDVNVLLFEGGEAMRFDPETIQVGALGVLRVLHALNMRESAERPAPAPTREGTTTQWLRAGRSGILYLEVGAGDEVTHGQTLGWIADTFDRKGLAVRAPQGGLIIGQTTNPLVNRGDAILHLATLAS